MTDPTPDEPPRFSLPEWGTAGAPQLPPETDEPDAEGAAPATTVALVTTTHAAHPSSLLTATGSAESDDGERAAAEASGQALERLAQSATALGARSVVGVRLTLTGRRDRVTAVAYGTAVWE